MGVITISRQVGAAETAIAPALAKELGWECLDSALLDQSVKQAGGTLPYVERFDERVPTLVEGWKHPGEAERYFAALKRVIWQAYEKGNAVIVGRGGHCILKDTDAIHVRLVADMDFRIRRVMEVRWASESRAREIIAASDRDRAAFHRKYFDTDWEDPLCYTLVLNTSRMSIEEAVLVLATLARSRDAGADNK